MLTLLQRATSAVTPSLRRSRSLLLTLALATATLGVLVAPAQAENRACGKTETERGRVTVEIFGAGGPPCREAKRVVRATYSKPLRRTYGNYRCRSGSQGAAWFCTHRRALKNIEVFRGKGRVRASRGCGRFQERAIKAFGPVSCQAARAVMRVFYGAMRRRRCDRVNCSDESPRGWRCRKVDRGGAETPGPEVRCRRGRARVSAYFGGE